MIDSVSEDVWLYDWSEKYGTLAFAYTSQFMWAIRDSNDLTKWFVEIGIVADQTFAHGQSPSNTDNVVRLYIGDGEYTTLFPTNNEYITI